MQTENTRIKNKVCEQSSVIIIVCLQVVLTSMQIPGITIKLQVLDVRQEEEAGWPSSTSGFCWQNFSSLRQLVFPVL